MATGDIIRQLREQLYMTQEDLAEKANVNRVTVAKYETGRIKPSAKTLGKIASALNTTTDYLLGLSDTLSAFTTAYPMPASNNLPIYGSIKCGPGGLAMEELLGYAQAAYDPETHFCLMAYGDSMAPKINDGATVIIHRQEDIESGEIAAVIVDDEEGMLKRVVKHDNSITLISINPAYEPRVFVGKEMNRVRIVGKAVEKREAL